MGSDAAISPLELESLAATGNSSPTSKGGLDRLAASSIPSNPIDKLRMLIKLYFELYPKQMIGASSVLVVFLLFSWSPWQGWGAAKNSTRNSMTHDYTALQDDFNFQTAQIDHWCLFGGDDRCYCEDPTEPVSRSEVPGWSRAHGRNRRKVDRALASRPPIDVVFFGDQNIQSWDGRWLDKPAPEGRKISKLFNQTFVDDEAAFQGLALGIYGDRINNILWRIKHGELPQTLNPKVFWLIMGTNDLALGMCSEEVVTLGIMRIAEEIHHLFPASIVVIQGILPRSNHKDGSLGGSKHNKYTDRHSSSSSSSHHSFIPHKSNDPTKYRERTAGGGADINQYMPMTPGMGGRQRQLLAEGEINALDDVLMKELEDALEEDEEDLHRQLQDLTTPGASPETTTTASTTAAGVSAGSVKVDAPLSDQPLAVVQKVMPKEEKAPQPHFDYYLWPSIQAINKELEGFCTKHEHFVFFDADNLVLGSIGNDYYRAAHKTIIAELMPNYVHLSHMGHQVVMGAIGDELKRIIYDDDERNDIEGGKGSRQ